MALTADAEGFHNNNNNNNNPDPGICTIYIITNMLPSQVKLVVTFHLSLGKSDAGYNEKFDCNKPLCEAKETIGNNLNLFWVSGTCVKSFDQRSMY